MYTRVHTQCTRVYASQVVCMDTRPKLCVWIRVPSCVYGYASQLCVWIRVPTVSLYDFYVNSMVFYGILWFLWWILWFFLGFWLNSMVFPRICVFFVKLLMKVRIFVSFVWICFFCLNVCISGDWKLSSVWNWRFFCFVKFWRFSRVCTWFLWFWGFFLFETEFLRVFLNEFDVFWIFFMILWIFLWFLWFFLWFYDFFMIFLWFYEFFYDSMDFLWFFLWFFDEFSLIVEMFFVVHFCGRNLKSCVKMCNFVSNCVPGGPMEIRVFWDFGNSMDFWVFLDMKFYEFLWILWIFYDFMNFFMILWFFLWF